VLAVLATGCVRRSEARELPGVGARPAQIAAQRPATRASSVVAGRVVWHGERPRTEASAHAGNVAGCPASGSFEALRIEPDGGVAGAVITVEGAAGAEVSANVVIDQRLCEFAPHVVAIPIGGRITLANADSVLHTAHAFRDGESDFNLATPPGLRIARTMTTAGVYHLRCDVGHTWMSGWIHVVNTPFVAVTGADGTYRIEHVPSGTYTLRMVHEGWTPQGSSDDHGVHGPPVVRTVRVTIARSGSLTQDFALP